MTADGVKLSVRTLLVLVVRAARGMLSSGGQMGRFVGADFLISLLQLAQLRLCLRTEPQLVGAVFQLAGEGGGGLPLLLRRDGALLADILYALDQRVIGGGFSRAIGGDSFDGLGHGWPRFGDWRSVPCAVRPL